MSPLGGVGDKEVEIAVVVIVEEEGPLGVTDMLQARLLGGILERAVAPVAEEEVAAPRAGDVQVLQALVPGVGKDSSDADAVAHADACLGGHIGEGAVTVVAV